MSAPRGEGCAFPLLFAALTGRSGHGLAHRPGEPCPRLCAHGSLGPRPRSSPRRTLPTPLRSRVARATASLIAPANLAHASALTGRSGHGLAHRPGEPCPRLCAHGSLGPRPRSSPRRTLPTPLRSRVARATASLIAPANLAHASALTGRSGHGLAHRPGEPCPRLCAHGSLGPRPRSSPRRTLPTPLRSRVARATASLIAPANLAHASALTGRSGHGLAHRPGDLVGELRPIRSASRRPETPRSGCGRDTTL